jgi:uracil-DNA glycosylase family 4
MSFVPLLELTSKHTHSHTHHKSTVKTAGTAGNGHKPIGKRGCEHCPLNPLEKQGVKKIKGKVRGHKIFIWAQSPGKEENKEGIELFGPSGQFLWQELKRVGITRKHCDIQNVVRCWPVDAQENMWPRFKMRAPTKEEVKCCSVYNERALEKSKAKLHLIFGQIAGAALLKKEFSPQNKRIFYSENMHGWVVYLDHPAYFIRMGYGVDSDQAPNDALKRFREDLTKAKQLLKKQNYDQFGYIKEQKYIGVTDRKTALKAYRELKKVGEHKGFLVYDMESGMVDKETETKPDDDGKYAALCCGFAVRPGKSYVFCLSKVYGVASSRALHLNHKLVEKLLKNKHIKKSAHYGVSDYLAVSSQLGYEVEGYDYDTLLGEYFRDPDAKAYGLEKITERRMPDFMGYKNIRWPEAFTKAYREQIEGKKIDLDKAGEVAHTTQKLNLARLPWKKTVLYNGADCDVELRVDESTRKYVNQPLMDVYRDASFILHRMEVEPDCQPLFDEKWSKKLDKIFRPKQKRMRRKLKKVAGKYAWIPKRTNGKIDWDHGKRIKMRFNPDSNDHLNWLVYDKWGISVSNGKGGGRNVRKGTLNRIAIRHKKVAIIPKYNGEKKVVTTYLVSYRKCAKLNHGHLRTNWKITGTGTGRLSSGATKDKKNLKVINLQNVHGDPLIKCQIISDLRWRKLYDYWRKHGDFTKKTWKKFKDYMVQLGFDFSQNELREVAEQSGDRKLAKMFASGKDPHVEVGHELTGWAKELIAHDDRVRRVIKNMQFGIVFGLQGEGLYQYCLALGAKTTRDEVDRFHRRYFKKFKRVKWLQEKLRAFAKEHGYSLNPYGFRRNSNVEEQEEAEAAGEGHEGGWWGNVAINTPIQSAAHHFLTMAFALLRRKPKKYKLLQRPQLEVHDALYNNVKLKYLLRAAKLGHELMVDEPMRISEEEFGIKKKVPLATKPKAGFRFGVHIEGIGKGKLATEWGFLNVWCRENRKLEHSYYKQLAAAGGHHGSKRHRNH